MSDDFRPGDLVECVDTSPSEYWGTPPLTLREVYTVERVRPSIEYSPGIWSGVGLRIEGVEPPAAALWGGKAAFHAWRFRKLYTPNPKFIASLLAETVFMPPVKPVKVGV